MIEVIEREDGWWTWRWTDDGLTFRNSKSYSSPDEAAKSASRAYPEETIVVTGAESHGDGRSATLAQDLPYAVRKGQAPTGQRKRRGKRSASPGPGSRLVRLVILVLVYLRSRASGRGGGDR